MNVRMCRGEQIDALLFLYAEFPVKLSSELQGVAALRPETRFSIAPKTFLSNFVSPKQHIY